MTDARREIEQQIARTGLSERQVVRVTNSILEGQAEFSIEELLNLHDIETRWDGETLECQDDPDEDGLERWITAPTTIAELRDWLGY